MAHLGALYTGLVKDMAPRLDHLRRTAHTHDPLDDARGSAEAMLHMGEQMGLEVRWR